MKHSDFADEWFEKEEETIFSEKIENFPHGSLTPYQINDI